MTKGYLSQDRAHLANLQRKRRAGVVRIDYMPSKQAACIMEFARAQAASSATATNSALLDALLIQWAELTGLNNQQKSKPMSSGAGPASCHPQTFTVMTSEQRPNRQVSARQPAPNGRKRCGAKRHCDGQPCNAWSEPGKQRCRFHGGRSSGPTSPMGRVRALQNLKQNRRPT